MRQAATTNALQKAEMATSALKLLANPDANDRVRATAAWTLGMLRVNSQINKYNYHLIAYEVGSLAADFGETVNDSIPKPPPKKVVPKKDGGKAKAKDKEEAKPKEEADDDEKNSTPTVANHSLAELYTGMLVKELYQALNGTEGASDSGMAHVPSSTLGPTATIVRQITDLEAAIAKAAAELVAAGPGQIVEAQEGSQRSDRFNENLPHEKSSQGSPSRPWLTLRSCHPTDRRSSGSQTRCRKTQSWGRPGDR